MHTSEEKLLAALSHGFYFLVPVLGPLVIFLIYRDKSPWVANHAKEALVAQLTLAVAGVVGSILTVILIGILILAVTAVAGIVYAIFSIIGIIKAASGEEYHYPITSEWAQKL